MARQPDKVARLLRIQQRAIRRGTTWWIDAIERMQSGDLDARTWLKAQSRYFKDTCADLKEILALLPLGRETCCGDDDEA